MANLKKLTVGQILYTVAKRRMGNTTMSTTVIRSHTVISINHETKSALIRLNGTSFERSVKEDRLKQYRVKKPELTESITGSMKLKKKQQ